jgi:hypothetical protein
MKSIPASSAQWVSRIGYLTFLFCAAAFVTLAAPVTHASDPTGIYAFVDRVVLEPNDGAPERIQIWGGFTLAKRENRNDYHDAERGYLYFKLRPGDEEVCKKEWADLKSVAGTKQIVAFGSRFDQPAPKVRKPDAKTENPDVHPSSVGVTKVRKRDYSPITQLEKLQEKAARDPSPAAPQPKGQ